MCGTARTSELGDCGRAGFTDDRRLEECRQIAVRRYRACLAGGDFE
jgi:hypothetical protein